MQPEVPQVASSAITRVVPEQPMTSQGEGRHRVATGTSRVDQALLRLHRSLERAVVVREEQAEALLSTWRAKWSGRREQISGRLEVIEAHIERLSAQAEPSPRLAVVSDSSDNEMDHSEF
jgi:hypothetical protein